MADPVSFDTESAPISGDLQPPTISPAPPTPMANGGNPLPTHRGSPWAAILEGALTGLAGASTVRGGGFGSGAGAGFENVLRQRQIATENQQRQQQINSDIQFRSAQAADMVITARRHQTELDNLPQQLQDEHTKANMQILEDMKNTFPGLQIVATPNDPKSLTAAMQSRTQSDGGVGPAIHLNAGGTLFSIPLDQPAIVNSGGAALQQVNDMRKLQGTGPIDSAIWASMSPAERSSNLEQSAHFTNPIPSDQNLTVYKNYLETATKNKDQASIDKLQPIVDQLQKGVTDANQRAADKAQQEANAKKQGEIGAETSPENVKALAGAAANKAAAEEMAKQNASNKPGYAVAPDGSTIQTTYADAQAKGLKGFREVKEADISKDQHDIKVLNDVEAKSQNVANSAKAMDANSWTQAVGVAKYLSDHPDTTSSSIVNSKILQGLSPQARAYVINVLSLRESAMGLQKVLTGSARSNEQQIKALQATLPGFEGNSSIVGQKLAAFNQNLGMLSEGLPTNTGVALQVKPQGSGSQPIYASAPGKPRLMSLDGGKTWQTAQ